MTPGPVTLAILLLSTTALSDDPKIVPSAEAKNHVGSRATVEMVVKASKDSLKMERVFLDSEEEYADEKNFTVIIKHESLSAFREKGISEPAEHYRDKSLRVTGEIVRDEGQTRIFATSPDQIEVNSP